MLQCSDQITNLDQDVRLQSCSSKAALLSLYLQSTHCCRARNALNARIPAVHVTKQLCWQAPCWQHSFQDLLRPTHISKQAWLSSPDWLGRLCDAGPAADYVTQIALRSLRHVASNAPPCSMSISAEREVGPLPTVFVFAPLHVARRRPQQKGTAGDSACLSLSSSTSLCGTKAVHQLTQVCCFRRQHVAPLDHRCPGDRSSTRSLPLAGKRP